MKRKLYTFFSIVVLCCLLSSNNKLQAQTETIKQGSILVNMGITPQTDGNALKPYGMIYELLKSYRIPVKWIIATGKSKDAIDLTHNGVNYRSGTFIIPAEARNATIDGVINRWKDSGVVVNTSVSDFTTEIFMTMRFAPSWTLDKENGMIALPYYSRAGIPEAAYGGTSQLGWKNPSELGACDDIFVMPHADPTWATHKNLMDWNLKWKGNLWTACHAGSALENLKDPSGTVQMNFLSTHGLVTTNLHKKDGAPPYSYSLHDNPIMQFMGPLDLATTNGSEQSYLPVKGGSWRTSTFVGVNGNQHLNYPLLTDGPTAIAAWGRGFGDENRGWVMYEAGHSHDGSKQDNIAAIRAFYNFSFFSTNRKNVWADVEITGFDAMMTAGQPANFTFTVPSGVDLSLYQVNWHANIPGEFTQNGNQNSATFTPDPMFSGDAMVSVTITDPCNRDYLSTKATFVAGVLGSSSTQLLARYSNDKARVQLQWNTDGNKTVNRYELERSTDSKSFKAIGMYLVEVDMSKGSFSYDDKEPIPGNNFYRIKIFYVDGSISYSNVYKVSAAKITNTTIKILGNPTAGQIVTSVLTDKSGTLRTTLMDYSGRKIATHDFSIQSGYNRLDLGNYSQLPSGIYLLQFQLGQQRMVEKIRISK